MSLKKVDISDKSVFQNSFLFQCSSIQFLSWLEVVLAQVSNDSDVNESSYITPVCFFSFEFFFFLAPLSLPLSLYVLQHFFFVINSFLQSRGFFGHLFELKIVLVVRTFKIFDFHKKIFFSLRSKLNFTFVRFFK